MSTTSAASNGYGRAPAIILQTSTPGAQDDTDGKELNCDLDPAPACPIPCLSAMPPALKPVVPSRRLLRFLRAQSEGLIFAECAATLPGRRHACTCSRSRLSSLGRASLTRRQPLLRSLFVGLESVFPESTSRLHPVGASAKSQYGFAETAGGARRYYSSKCSSEESSGRLTLRELLFGSGARKQSEAMKEDEIMMRLQEDSGAIFQRRSLTSKAALDPRLRCTEVDGNGNVIMVDGELKKSELIAKVLDGPRHLQTGIWNVPADEWCPLI